MIAIIINSQARNAEKVKLYLDQFNESNLGFDLYETESKDLTSTIEKCISKYKIILIGGGDGSIRTAAQYCANTSIQLGVLPLGTMNHLAKELNLPQSPEELVAVIKNQSVCQVDVGEVNGLIFLNNSSIGFYPKFTIRRIRYGKFYNKWISYIPSFIDSLKKHEVFKVDIKSKNLNRSLKTSFLMISNNIYSLKFPLTIKRDSFKDATLGLYYFKQGKIRLMKILRSLFNNKKNFEILKSEAPIEMYFLEKDEVSISLDGEVLKVKNPLHYKSRPKSLNLLMNNDENNSNL
ncbi:MAG: diacylglycerol kinase [Tatlockia sp.]|nr:diacylglycerol kinase [Tatlockia sp.]